MPAAVSTPLPTVVMAVLTMSIVTPLPDRDAICDDVMVAMTAAIRKYMNENKGAFDPRDYLKPARAAAKALCKQRYEQFGCAGMASRIKPIALEAMAQRYAKGELAQVVN